jgi:hypothetical protein
MLTLANVLRILAILSVAVCGILETAIFSWVPVATILMASIFGVRANRDNPERLNEVAEQAYFIGYVSTISAFAAAVLNIYIQGHIPERPTTLLLMGAIALMTTVAGLLCMTAIKEYSATIPSPHPQTPDLNDFLRALMTLAKAAELATATRSLAEFIETKDQLLRDLGGALNEANDVKTTLSSLCTRITDAKADFEAVSSSASASHRDVNEVNQVLDRFVASIFQRLTNEGDAIGAGQ